ncbi:hypothetical protein RHGRI_006503 [Rhododendron griersonianum]|uniref:Uncharacterized protein n=1 Tax=Rhododendron griersonianum TaxID=479676 RepID=A0AAV6KUE3_9ERIC|nr:hypothetical protein RHGRI_006503 [Rhododendron griersonianum]
MQTCHQTVKGSFGSNNRKGYCKIHLDNMLGKQSPKTAENRHQNCFVAYFHDTHTHS